MYVKENELKDVASLPTLMSMIAVAPGVLWIWATLNGL